MMDMILCCLVFVSLALFAQAGELTFELPDNEKQCFFEIIDKDVDCTIEYQVITGGNYDVDMELMSPSGNFLYKQTKKQYDSYDWKTVEAGEYKFCFSNEFSTFTHKVVYFDFMVGDEDEDFLDIEEGGPTAMTQMESAAVTIHEALKVVIDYQTHHRLRESKGRGFAEDLNIRVQFWSIGVFCVVVVVGIGQVLVLRSFFTDKKNLVRT